MVGTAPTRRGFLASMLAAGALPVPALSAGRLAWPLAVQLWSVDAQLKQDFAGTLQALGRLGYREVETAGLHGRSPRAFRAAADRAGLRLVSAHFSMADLFNDAPARIAEAKALGVQWVVASAPRPERALPPGDWAEGMRKAMTLSAWQHNAARLNGYGRAVAGAGMQFAYHNHPFEFAFYEGRRALDLLLAASDPAIVKLELDVAWAIAGGADPLQLLRRHGDRIRLLHLKGLKTRPPIGRYGSDFRTGILGTADAIDWRPILAAARQAGVRHAFVEQEPPTACPILESLAACRDYLRRL